MILCREYYRHFIIVVVVFICVLFAACGSDPPSDTTNIAVVSRELGTNELGIDASHLRETPNPKGEGVFVYVPQTEYRGVERHVVWMVIEEKAFPLNGATKNITPSLPWPREAPNGLWENTGLDKFQATEAIQIVFE